ncbi:hypothetical protein CEQ90_15030 [Lewinellaceae bacterium SD302]|nr:hypothetical protein CEQ90_15030 [Lewinellaceae bacterium SD302]
MISPVVTLTPGDEPLEDPANPGASQDTLNGGDANGDMTIDFGFVPTLSVGSTVFYDQDNDGEQDEDNPLEAGIDSIQVILVQVLEDAAGMDSLVVIDSVLTDEDGNYLFDSLAPGDYQVVVIAPEDAQTNSEGQSNADDDIDGVDDGMQTMAGDSTFSGTFTLSVGDEPQGAEEDAQGGDLDDTDGDASGNMTIDFGFVPDLSIGSTVFYDPNDDGVQDLTDPLEGGIAGVVVELYSDLDGDGVAETLVGTDTTDAEGNYFFDMLPEGDYQVVIPTPDASAPSSSTGTNEVAGNDTDTDLDDNGDQANSGDQVSSNVFPLSAGDQPIEPMGNPGADQDDADDDDGNMTVDFGFVPNLSIGSTVFLDEDNNGEQDDDEMGLDSVLVLLSIDTSGNGDFIIIDSVLTDPDGNYIFDSLPPGDYVVSIVPPADAPLSSDGESGLDDDMDGNDDGIQVFPGDTISSPTITLTPGEEPQDEEGQAGNQDAMDDENGNMTIDFGLVPVGSIGSQVFADLDNNGMFDMGSDLPLEGVIVELYEDADMDGVPDGPAIATDTTDAGGLYFFGMLSPGSYVVGIPTAPEDYTLSSTPTDNTEDTDGNDDGIQEMAGDPTFSGTITLTIGMEPGNDVETFPGGMQDDDMTGGAGPVDVDTYGDMTVDFGFTPAVSVGSTVWLDNDNDGMLDVGEPGIPGVQVVLFDSEGMPVDTAITDENGNYFFGGLPQGDYYIEIPADQLMAGGLFPMDASSSTPDNDADNDTDGNDDGMQVGGPGTVIVSDTFTLTADTEPEDGVENGPGAQQDNADDNNGNMTVDFGIFVNMFDLALIKELAPGQEAVVEAGDTVAFIIRVINQGNLAADSIRISDYLPNQEDGFMFDPSLNPGWSVYADINDTLYIDTLLTTFNGADTLAMDSFVTIPVFLVVNPAMEAIMPLTNLAEISGATGPNGEDVMDIDSPMDTIPGNDDFFEDNEIDGDGLSGGDEDNSDPATIFVGGFDLALEKVLADGQSSTVDPGDDVIFEIIVSNQGAIPADNIGIVDYIPEGFIFYDSLNATFMLENDSIAYDTLSVAEGSLPEGGLLPGQSTSVFITLTVAPPMFPDFEPGVMVDTSGVEPGQALVNGAEITTATDDEGEEQIDIDSNADDINDDNDDGNEVDGEVNGDGLNGEDEDDNDIAVVNVSCYQDAGVSRVTQICLGCDEAEVVVNLFDLLSGNPNIGGVFEEGEFEFLDDDGNPLVITDVDGNTFGDYNFDPTMVVIPGTLDRSLDYSITYTILAINGCPEDVATITLDIIDIQNLSCTGFTNISLGEDCEAEITPDLILAGDLTCASSLTVELIDANGNSVGNTVGSGDIGQTFFVNLIDEQCNNTCWGQILVEDKRNPNIDCPDDANGIDGVDFICTDIDQILNLQPVTYTQGGVVPAVLGLTGEPIATDNCTPDAQLEITFRDILLPVSDPQCDDRTILRTFTVEDGSGNIDICIQEITVRAPTLDDVNIPQDSIFQVECNTEFDMLPNGNPTPAAVGGPSITTALGTFDIEGNGAFCNIAASFVDGPPITTCENTFKFVRTWNIFNWCNVDEPALVFTQVVKVGDFSAPTFTVPTQDLDFDGIPDQGPLFFSTNSDECSSVFAIPGINAIDNCSPTVNVDAFIFPEDGSQTLGAFSEGELTTAGIPRGLHTLLYVATDLCGNADSLEVMIEVGDATAPVAICEDGLNVSIGGGGTAELCATDINAASYDDCSDIDLGITRVNDNDEPVDANGNLILPAFTAFQECITLTCDEIGIVRVALRVTDDADLDGEFEPQYGGDDNVNFCWLDVLVEDKTAPICVAPIPVTFDCSDLDEDFPQDLSAAFVIDPIGTTALLDEVFGAATGIDNCDDLTIEQSVLDLRSSCGTGIITRTFTVTDGAGFTSAPGCTQTITVLGLHDYTVVFPGDEESDDCVEPDYNGVTFTENGCDLITVSTVIDTFTATADECYKLRISYEVLNWCEYNTIDPAYEIPRDADGDGILDMDSTVLHVLPNDQGLDDDVAILDRDVNRNNFNTIDELDTGDGGILPGSSVAGYGQDASRGAFTYVQFIKVYDDNPPTLVVTEPDSAFCSLNNDCVADVELLYTIMDECSPMSVSATVELDAFIDAGADGIFTLAEFIADGGNVTDAVSVSDTTAGEFAINLPNIPIGRHAVRIVATDGCGNTAIELLVFEVEDCKAPTPICINGLTATLMPDGEGGGMAAIWVSDFIASSVDDCTGPVEFAIYIDGEQPMIPSPADTGLLLNCDHLGPQSIRIYAIDGNGNADYCVTSLLVQAFAPDVCDTPGSSIAGLITTETMIPISGVDVSLAGTDGTASNIVTSDNGMFFFASLPGGEDYTITPSHFSDYMNGVSTGDIVTITRHILGIEAFSSPFQYIAADVDGSENVNIVDIIGIRRLILGLDDVYPNGMPSWRFVAADYDFPQVDNPWAEAFPEVHNYNNLMQNITDSDFIGAKLGDVNGNVQANSLQGPEARDLRGDLFLEMDELQLEAGETYRVPVRASELAQVRGYQFTLEFDNLAAELISIEDGLVEAGSFGWRFANQGLITTSWNWQGGNGPRNWGADEVLFTLVLNAQTQVALSEVFSVSSRFTVAEAYDNDGSLRNVGMVFDLLIEVTADYRLLQNSPNPFQRETVIGYELPEATPVTITVTDVRGRLVRTYEQEGTAGFNNLRVTRREIGAAGVYYYTLTAGEWTASKKMIILD